MPFLTTLAEPQSGQFGRGEDMIETMHDLMAIHYAIFTALGLPTRLITELEHLDEGDGSRAARVSLAELPELPTASTTDSG